MKFDSRALNLIKQWNGHHTVGLDELLQAYRLGMRCFGSHDTVMILLQAWLQTASTAKQPFVRFCGNIAEL